MSTEANGEPIFKRTASLRRRPGPQPPVPSRDELFRDLYKLAFGAMHAQFFPQGIQRSGPMTELERSKQIARIARNSAVYGCMELETSAFDEEISP